MIDLLARETAEKFARLENPDDPQLDAYGDLEALVLTACQQALTAHTAETALTFNDIAAMSLSRANRWHPGGIEEWSPMEWAGAMAGEAGEACNAAKKLKRVETQIAHHDNRVFGDSAPTDEQADAYRVQVAKEAADTILYAVLVMQRVGANPSHVLIDVFNRKSEEYGFPERLKQRAEAAEASLLQLQQEKDQAWRWANYLEDGLRPEHRHELISWLRAFCGGCNAPKPK